MLDEPEFASLQETYRAGAEDVKHARRLADRPLSKSDTARIGAGVAARYLELTGVSGLDSEEILRHRLSRLGPPCQKCGKELRSPRAKKCLECGHGAES
jgi:hypothetical protein